MSSGEERFATQLCSSVSSDEVHDSANSAVELIRLLSELSEPRYNSYEFKSMGGIVQFFV